MSRTENFRRQHREILEVADAMTRMLDGGALDGEAAASCEMLLTELTGKIKLHLAMEDNAMYPRLLQHKDKEVSTLASHYVAEMGGIKTAYLAYAQKWLQADAIAKRSEDFSVETKSVLAALLGRITKEDNELYPLVDRYGG